MTVGRVLLVCVTLYLAAAVLDAKPNGKSNAVVEDDKKKPCCLPDQYQTLISVVKAVYLKRSKHAFSAYETYNFSSDAQQEKMVITYPGCKDHKAFRYLADFKNGKRYYIVGGDEGLCITRKMDARWDICVPEDSLDIGQYVLGANDESLTLESWYVHYPGFGHAISFNKNCVPVSILSTMNTEDVKALITTSYVDLVTTIRDPSIFDVPKSCERRGEMTDFTPDQRMQMAINLMPTFHNAEKSYYKH